MWVASSSGSTNQMRFQGKTWLLLRYCHITSCWWVHLSCPCCCLALLGDTRTQFHQVSNMKWNQRLSRNLHHHVENTEASRLMDWAATWSSASSLWAESLLDYLDYIKQAKLVNPFLTYVYSTSSVHLWDQASIDSMITKQTMKHIPSIQHNLNDYTQVKEAEEVSLPCTIFLSGKCNGIRGEKFATRIPLW